MLRENAVGPTVRTNMTTAQRRPSGSAKAKAAAPKGKAKAAAAKAKSATVAVEINSKNNNGYLSDWSDNEDPSPVAAGKMMKKKLGNHVRKDKIVKIKRKPEKVHINVGVDTQRKKNRERLGPDRLRRTSLIPRHSSTKLRLIT